MKTYKYDRIGINIVLILILTSTLLALPSKRKGFLEKTNTLEYIMFDANQIWCYTGNNGEIVSYHVTSESGLYWPGGTIKTAVFQSGLWVVGMVGSDIRSAAAEYTSEFQPGKIIYDQNTKVGYADNSSLARYQVWSINKGDSPDPASASYNKEYALWPVADGAPAHDGEYFTDANGNNTYDDGEVFEDFNRDGSYNGPDGVITEGDDPPLIIGDQMHWSVFNDYNATTHAALWSTQPLGIEIQSTVFGFDRADPLGNVMFVKWLIINKSGQTVQDAYVSMWSDPDLGTATDDYVGCDTNLSVGYCYNGDADDQVYGSTPPCVGYDFFQGPIVPSTGDTALVSGKLIPDYKNLPMTSFVKYTNSDASYPDPETATEAYNYMKGLTAQGANWRDPEGNIVYYLYTGDPVTGVGYTEYDDATPDDRRFLLSSGPFSMETWTDTNGDGFAQVGEPGVQEIVGAIVIAAGTTNLNAISAMKYFDAYAQNAYDAQFDLPSPPAPKVVASELDEQIILTWQEDADAVENYTKLGYNFEGYNVYQGESSTGEWTLVKTYDVDNAVTTIIDKNFDVETGLILESPVQFGNDSGPKRYIDITTDKLNGNSKLINGRVYYFAVTSYAYNPNAAPKVIESSKSPIIVRPHEPALGAKLETATDDLLEVVHTGLSETTVSAKVINPLQLNGDEYAVVFSYDSAASQGSWSLVHRDASGATLDSLIKKNTVLDEYTTEMMEGFQVTVKDIAFDAPVLNSYWEMTNNVIPTLVDSMDYISADIYQSGVDTTALINGDTVKIDTLCGTGKYWATWEKVMKNSVAWFRLKRTVLHEITIQGWANTQGGTTHLAASVPGMGDKKYNKGIQDVELLRSDIELRFTETGQNAIFWFKKNGFKTASDKAVIGHVPFEVWDIERNIQLCVGIADQDNDTTIYDASTNKLDADWIITIHKDYNEGDNKNTILPLLASECYSTSKPAQPVNDYTGWLIQLSASSIFSVEDTLYMNFLNPVVPDEDEFVFTATKLNTDLTKAEKKAQLKKINVFPNPYFGFNVEESGPMERFVTITHLPETGAMIRIFSLGGQLVAKIDHSNSDWTGTSFERWFLRNQNDIPVASGIYIIHIDVKDVGEKVLKIAVFQPEERLDVY